MVSAELELALPGFVEIPEGIYLDAIETGAFQAHQPVSPKLVGNAGVFQSGRHDEGAVAVYQETFRVVVDEGPRGTRRGKHMVVQVLGGSAHGPEAGEDQSGL